MDISLTSFLPFGLKTLMGWVEARIKDFNLLKPLTLASIFSMNFQVYFQYNRRLSERAAWGHNIENIDI
jgi:hypothetical protein